MTDFSMAKVAYSALLLAVLWFFAKELNRVWRDRQTYLATPTYFVDGKTDAAKAVAFGSLVLAHHHRLTFDLAAERKEALDSVGDAREFLPIRAQKDDGIRAPGPADALELKIQGFDVGALLAKLRSWVSPINEVHVQVDARSLGTQLATVEAAVSWPGAPVENDLQALRYFSTARVPSDDQAAATVASTLLWGSLRTTSPTIRGLPKDEFTAWILAWQRYRAVRDLQLGPDKLSAEHKKLLEQAGQEIQPFILGKPRFPEIWRLAANLVSLHPQSIPGQSNPWEFYRDAYLIAIGKQVTTAHTSTKPQGTSQPGFGPGTVVWREDGKQAVKVAAVVEDQNTKLVYLLLPDLFQHTGSTPRPDEALFAVDDHTGVRQTVAIVSKRMAIDRNDPRSVQVVLALLRPQVTATNSKWKIAANDPRPAEQLQDPRSGRSAAVATVGVSLDGLGSGLVAVQPKLTFAGDAGAPIVNANGELVAMGFAGTDEQSLLVPLADFLRSNQFVLK